MLVLVAVLVDAPLTVGWDVLETGGSRGFVANDPFVAELRGRSGMTGAKEDRLVVLPVPATGVVTLVERFRINFPWTTMLSLDFFKSLVNISSISKYIPR